MLNCKKVNFAGFCLTTKKKEKRDDGSSSNFDKKIQESFLSLMENLQAHVYLGQPLKNSGLKNLTV